MELRWRRFAEVLVVARLLGRVSGLYSQQFEKNVDLTAGCLSKGMRAFLMDEKRANCKGVNLD